MQPGLGQSESEFLVEAVPVDLVSYRSGQDSRIANDDNSDVLKALCMPDETAAELPSMYFS
jgi:hypothetical protein